MIDPKQVKTIPGFILPDGHILVRRLAFTKTSASSVIQLVKGAGKPVAAWWIVVDPGDTKNLKVGQLVVSNGFQGEPIEYENELYYRIAVGTIYGKIRSKSEADNMVREIAEIEVRESST